MDKNSKIYLAGHTGMVGSSIIQNLRAKGYDNIVTRSHSQLDLIRQSTVEDFFKLEHPDIVIIAAAKVGGILANNTYRADFIYDNLAIQTNLIHSAYRYGVDKLLFLGSSCIYPKNSPQPMKEEYLLTGELEPTNEPYAIAKIAGIKMCESYYHQYGCNFISVMPTNLYGPNDNFDIETSHVVSAMLLKFHEAKVGKKGTVTIWGTGKPRREFLFVDDMADACIYVLRNLNAEALYSLGITHFNIGTAEDITIAELAKLVADVVGFSGDIRYDTAKPDGVLRKLLDVTRVHQLGWHHQLRLSDGISKTYHWYLEHACS